MSRERTQLGLLSLISQIFKVLSYELVKIQSEIDGWNCIEQTASS